MRGNRRTAVRVTTGALIGSLAVGLVTLLSGEAPTAAQQPFEAPPVLSASEFLPSELRQGPRFRVEDRVPVEHFLARFTLRSDFGTFDVHGRALLATRVAEVAALAELERTGKTEEFLKAAGGAAAKPVRATAHMLANPVETVEGVPSAVGRFFDRVQLGGQRIAQAATAPGKTTEEAAVDVTKRVGGISADVLGYEQERRKLAKQLRVDPYTTNPVLSEKMNDIAWVAFSGRFGVNLATSVLVPYSMVISATSITNDMVWDTPPADLVKLAEQRLRATGAPASQVSALLRNPSYSLTMLTALAVALERLSGVPGRDQAVGFAAQAASETQARLIAGAAGMLADYHTGREPLADISGRGPLVARTRAGGLLVPLPIDYVAWTERVSAFTRREDLRARGRTVWLTGHVSPRARQELAAAGWTLFEADRQGK